LPDLTGGDTPGVKMLDNSLNLYHSCHFGRLDFTNQPPHERLDILFQLHQSMNSMNSMNSFSITPKLGNQNKPAVRDHIGKK
jgi:hypothetical protein